MNIFSPLKINETNKIKVQLADDSAKIPTRANEYDAGFDLYSVENLIIAPQSRKTVKTGISLEMPQHMAGLIWPRSGLSVKSGIDVLAGVIDSGYRGEIMVCLYNTSQEAVNIKHGDRVAQIIFQEVPLVSLSLSNTLGSSQRGDNGFGSTGE
jgi:dUTP pyrophosphatase